MLTRFVPLLVACCATAAAGQTAAVSTITAADLAAHIGVLAHDSMAGRFTPSPGLEAAAAYVSAEFARFGLRPAGDAGTFTQRYPLDRAVPDTSASFLTLGTAAPIAFGTDAISWDSGDTPATVTGRVRLVTGLLPSERALEVAGQIVIAALPTDGTGQLSSRARALLRALGEARPAAIVIPVDAPDAVWNAIVARQFRTSLGPAWEEDPRVPQIQVRDRAVAATLAEAGVDLAAARSHRGEARVRPLDLSAALLTRRRSIERVSAPNVAGFVVGADPALRDEVVVVSAHLDHDGAVGRGQCRGAGADSICNGADDNASGTASVLELAEAVASRPTRRTVLFLSVSGEERGLWGSEYFTSHPPVPLDRIVANVNLDMVGRNWPDTVVVIGREHSDLGATLARVEAAHPELGMAVRDDPWPAERFFYRSDHYNFARRGVPALFFFSGEHEDYHRPSDHADKIDTEKQARLTRLVYYLVREVADAPHRPAWLRASYDAIVGGPP